MDPYLKVIQKQSAEFPNLFNRWVRIRPLSFHPADLNKKFRRLKNIGTYKDINLNADTVLTRIKGICEPQINSFYSIRISDTILSPLFSDNVFILINSIAIRAL